MRFALHLLSDSAESPQWPVAREVMLPDKWANVKNRFDGPTAAIFYQCKYRAGMKSGKY
jgi:hypothetical protein